MSLCPKVCDALHLAGYPSVVYEDAHGARHALFIQPGTDMATVTAWRQAIDTPPVAPAGPKQTWTKADMLTALTYRETGLLIQAAQSDPTIAGVWYNFSERSSFTRSDFEQVLNIFVPSIFTPERTAEILG